VTPLAYVVHVFGRSPKRRPPQGAACTCGGPMGEDAVELRAGDVQTWRCRTCFDRLLAEWDERRRQRVREFLTSGQGLPA
jgi:hypothetical protein